MYIGKEWISVMFSWIKQWCKILGTPEENSMITYKYKEHVGVYKKARKLLWKPLILPQPDQQPGKI